MILLHLIIYNKVTYVHASRCVHLRFYFNKMKIKLNKKIRFLNVISFTYVGKGWHVINTFSKFISIKIQAVLLLNFLVRFIDSVSCMKETKKKTVDGWKHTNWNIWKGRWLNETDQLQLLRISTLKYKLTFFLVRNFIN